MMKVAALVFTLAILSVAITAPAPTPVKKAPAAKSPVVTKKTAGPAKPAKVAPKAPAKPAVKAKVAAKPKPAVKKTVAKVKKAPVKKVAKKTATKKTVKKPAKKVSIKKIKKDVKIQKKGIPKDVKRAVNVEKLAKNNHHKKAPVKKVAKKKVAKKIVKKFEKKVSSNKKIKKDVKKQLKGIPKDQKRAANVEKLSKNNHPKKDHTKEKKNLRPHPKQALKSALAGKSNNGKVGKNMDYSKLVVDSLNKYHKLESAIKKKDAKKVKAIGKWIKKTTHMSTKGFEKRFKAGHNKIKMEVLTNGATKVKSGKTPKELQSKIDKDSYDGELHKFNIGEAKGLDIPKKIQNTLKKIKRGKITDTKVGSIKNYNYMFVYVHQPAETK